MRSVSLSTIFGALLLLAACEPMTTMAQSRGASARVSQPVSVAAPAENRVSVTLYVDGQNPSAFDSNPGTAQRPFRTISAALATADLNNTKRIGTKVSIAPGIYREALSLPVRGDLTDAPLVVEAQQAGSVMVDGTDVWDGWQSGPGGNIFTHAWSYGWGLAPYPSGWEGSVVLQDITRRREMIFANGQPLRQVLSQGAMVDNSFFVSEQSATVFVRLNSQLTPQNTKIEVSVRPLLLRAQGRTNLVLRGLSFYRGNPAVPDSTVDIVDSSTVLIENCDFSMSNWDGMGVEKTTDVTIRNSTAKNNGASGMGGYQLKRFLLQSSEASYNNWRGAMGGFYGWAVAGSKWGSIHDGAFRSYIALGNQARGLWLDFDTVNVSVDAAVIGSNQGDGIFSEANEGPIAITNSYLFSNLSAIAVANSTDITITGNYMYWNTETQLKVTGELARPVSNWETGAQMTLSAARWTVQANTFRTTGVTATWIETPNWQPFLTTIASNTNLWLRPSDLRGFAIDTSVWTFQDWQTKLGVDSASLALSSW